MRFVVQNADYPVRFIVGNDAEFPVAGSRRERHRRRPCSSAAGQGGAVSIGLNGDGIGSIAEGGKGAFANCLIQGFASRGFDGYFNGPRRRATGKPAASQEAKAASVSINPA